MSVSATTATMSYMMARATEQNTTQAVSRIRAQVNSTDQLLDRNMQEMTAFSSKPTPGSDMVMRLMQSRGSGGVNFSV